MMQLLSILFHFSKEDKTILDTLWASDDIGLNIDIDIYLDKYSKWPFLDIPLIHVTSTPAKSLAAAAHSLRCGV